MCGWLAAVLHSETVHAAAGTQKFITRCDVRVIPYDTSVHMSNTANLLRMRNGFLLALESIGHDMKGGLTPSHLLVPQSPLSPLPDQQDENLCDAHI